MFLVTKIIILFSSINSLIYFKKNNITTATKLIENMKSRFLQRNHKSKAFFWNSYLSFYFPLPVSLLIKYLILSSFFFSTCVSSLIKVSEFMISQCLAILILKKQKTKWRKTLYFSPWEKKNLLRLKKIYWNNEYLSVTLVSPVI